MQSRKSDDVHPTPIQLKFIKSVFDMELFCARATGLTWTLKEIDRIAENKYKGLNYGK